MRRTRTYPRIAGAIEGRPFADLNITPLIDVMLVLLVMFILAVPAVTHKVPVDLPQGGAPPGERVVHRLFVAADGSATLDGLGMSDAALAARLGPIARDPAALLSFGADPATRYERVDQLLARVKRAGVTRLGFEGLAAFRE